MERVAVIGAGSWGTTAAWLAAANASVHLWARDHRVAEEINASGFNSRYLPGCKLPPGLRATSDLAEAVSDADLIAVAVPSHGFREVFERIVPVMPARVPVISLTKGIEQDSLLRMTEIIGGLLPDHDPTQFGVLTGPNLASEVAAGQPTAAVVAVGDPQSAGHIQEVFMAPLFRVYTNDDVVGSELGGALKNVMAIAAGMSDGLGFGDNTRATLITRALAELTRLGVRLGGRPGTFAGLAGMGDLIATCVSDKSRNHRVGFGMAQGRSLDEVIGDMQMVAEGVKTTRAVIDLAARFDVEMPIANHVGRVLYEGLGPREAMLSLMTREAKPE
ncbi:MAG: NAD(P)H-dependent glycerol-3-phosphate dehydrogenase [Acidimicrobiia bacterium]